MSQSDEAGQSLALVLILVMVGIAIGMLIGPIIWAWFRTLFFILIIFAAIVGVGYALRSGSKA